MSERGAIKKIFKDPGGFTLTETAMALALVGVLSAPVTGYLLLQQRFLNEAGEASLREQQILCFFEKLGGELAAVQSPWWDPPPAVETAPGSIRVTWSQGGQLRSLVLEGNQRGWVLTVDGLKGASLISADLDFSPILQGELCCGIQAFWRGGVFCFYTGLQPFPLAFQEDLLLSEVR